MGDDRQFFGFAIAQQHARTFFKKVGVDAFRTQHVDFLLKLQTFAAYIENFRLQNIDFATQFAERQQSAIALYGVVREIHDDAHADNGPYDLSRANF